MSQPKAEFDSPWKMILDTYFENFMAYCWPERHAEIDWNQKYRVLDKELIKIARNAPIGNRVIDKLVEISLKNGKEAFILLHLEIQGNIDPYFEERMFIYRYRLRDLHRKPIASLAILIDRDENWRPGVFKEELWGSSVEMRFPILKLLDYRERVQELEAAHNPFSQVILAQLAALERQLPEARLASKISLIKRLYQKGWQRNDIVNLLIFIDWVIALPEALEPAYQDAIRILEEELHVNYMTSFERSGIEKGIQEGIQQGVQQGIQQGVQQGEGTMLIRLLERKFKTVPENYRQHIETASPEDLLEWAEKVLISQSIEEVFRL
jgi:hypothetical protein